ncbi:MAG: RNA-binding S4 domain-containing protein [Candidatus Rokubacteria bacterium]|nr:RNA-binding S4 domain-containing protein [Candidatus Rokubacteria bacterium]
MNEVRVDKWLWAARFFKSRSLAAAACDGGKVDVNRNSAKPAKLLRAGDMLRITLPRGKKIIKVLALAERRGSALRAQLLYEDLTPPPPPELVPTPPPVYRPRGSGRPTKRERRLLDRLGRW